MSGSVAATCRYYGISRQCYYKWQRRYEAEGIEGLRDRSSAPHHTPHATEADVVEKILWLRQQYHVGPVKIAMYLERYHDIKVMRSRPRTPFRATTLVSGARSARRPTGRAAQRDTRGVGEREPVPCLSGTDFGTTVYE